MTTNTGLAKSPHVTSIHYEGPTHDEPLFFDGGWRAGYSCGWGSDCYSDLSDTQRAIKVHLLQVLQPDINVLIIRSSIGAALDDVKKRGIEAHLVDLEREMRPKRGKKSIAKKLSNKST